MSPLSAKQRSLLRLIRRSTADADGWYQVSSSIWPLFDDADEALIEKRPEGGGGKCRLTDKGAVVLEYLT